jgi:ectoine hydroxylase-related dioxygenase (phytanoyl-CoA dioxygenase family)
MLTSEQVEFFKDNGYLQVDNFYTQEQIAEYRAALEEARNTQGVHSHQRLQGGPYSKYEQKVNLWRDYPKLRELTLDPRRASLVRQLTGSKEVRLFHDHYLIKPALDSAASSWHQDQVAWPMAGEGPINCWIPFQDVTVHNGAMAYIAGSHKWGVVKYKTSIDDEHIQVEGKTAEETKATPMPMKAGGVLFHHGLTLHYAYPNQSDHPRFAMTIISMPEWITYTGKRHLVTNDLELNVGEKFEHELFPVL